VEGGLIYRERAVRRRLYMHRCGGGDDDDDEDDEDDDDGRCVMMMMMPMIGENMWHKAFVCYVYLP
jgi:hypothetical protein